MDRADLLRLARAGAVARLAEIDQERQAILREFPDLRRARATAGGAVESEPAVGGRRRRKGMSAAQRKAVSERMRKYWAARRGTGAASAPTEGAAKKPARKGQAKSGARKGARKMSAEARKRIAAAQKARWAEWRKKKKGATA